MSSAEPFAFPVLHTDGAVLSAGTPVARADEILRQARKEASRISAQAQAEGHERGYAAGVEEGRSALAQTRLALDEAVAGVLAVRDAFLDQAEERSVELALLLADKIVGAALGVWPELVLDVVRGALRRAAERDHVVIEVNPSDLELVRNEAGDVAGQLGGVRQLEVVAEQRVPPGGCVVRTADGEIDARVETQLARATELLRESLAARD